MKNDDALTPRRNKKNKPSEYGMLCCFIIKASNPKMLRTMAHENPFHGRFEIDAAQIIRLRVELKNVKTRQAASEFSCPECTRAAPWCVCLPE